MNNELFTVKPSLTQYYGRTVTKEMKFDEDMKELYFITKKECRYNATRFLQIVAEKGGSYKTKYEKVVIDCCSVDRRTW